MTLVPRPDELLSGDDGIYALSGSNGSAHTLPMSEEQMAAVEKRKRLPFGFRTQTAKPSRESQGWRR